MRVRNHPKREGEHRHRLPGGSPRLHGIHHQPELCRVGEVLRILIHRQHRHAHHRRIRERALLSGERRGAPVPVLKPRRRRPTQGGVAVVLYTIHRQSLTKNPYSDTISALIRLYTKQPNKNLPIWPIFDSRHRKLSHRTVKYASKIFLVVHRNSSQMKRFLPKPL